MDDGSVAKRFPLLEAIDDPADLRRLDADLLPRLAAELRAFLLDSVARTGGHLASNLGTVELAIALHRVYDTPHDRIVWDVGHQAYPHKVLTGRRAAMATLRRRGGLSGFPRREESIHDAFGTAHSSTSISAAMGIAVGARDAGERRRVVAVIGDGALSAGMAFEALNNARQADADVAVIVNHNGMSISPAVGALQSELAAQALLADLGLPGTGPVDGHDLDALLAALATLRAGHGPRVLHVRTTKGRGYPPAERDPIAYHGVGRFDPALGLVAPAAAARPTFTQVFGDWLCEAAAADARVVAITPAMREGSGLAGFARRFPERFHDVGIAEQHALTFAAGLACEGRRPVVAIYSTFLQRAYDQLVHDIALQDLPVLLAIDRGGLAGADGPTHHGAFDLSYLRCIPNLAVMAPSDEDECRRLLSTGLALGRPAAVRYPRGAGIGASVGATGGRPARALPLGRAEVRRDGHGVAILAFGPLLHEALAAGDRLDATVVDMRFVKPLDEALVLELARRHELLVTIEDNAVSGGAGSAVAELVAAGDCRPGLLLLGLPDRFVEHGEAAQLHDALGLTRDGIAASILARLRRPALSACTAPALAPVLGQALL